MKLVQACFLAVRIPFFFRASALFHSDLASADRGDFLHVLNNFLAFFTRLAQFSFQHGLLGFCLVVPSGLTFLKFFPLADSRAFREDFHHLVWVIYRGEICLR